MVTVLLQFNYIFIFFIFYSKFYANFWDAKLSFLYINLFKLVSTTWMLTSPFGRFTVCSLAVCFWDWKNIHLSSDLFLNKFSFSLFSYSFFLKRIISYIYIRYFIIMIHFCLFFIQFFSCGCVASLFLIFFF